MDERHARRITVILYLLFVYDVILSTLTILFPHLWDGLIHGAVYDDPRGILTRTGAVWAAFSLLQLLAALKWRVQLFWLPLIAGIRLTEVFSDWTYLYVAQDVTWFGTFGLFVNPPMNLFLGWYFVHTYRRALREP